MATVTAVPSTGRQDVRRTPLNGGSDAPQRLTVTLLAILTGVRIAQLAAWPIAVATGGTAGLRSVAAAWAAYAVPAVVVVVVLVLAWAQRGLTPTLAVVDAGVSVLALLVGGWVTTPGAGTGFSHPTLPVGIGAALGIALAWPLTRALVGHLVLCVAYLGGVHATLALGPIVLSSVLGNLAMLVGVPVVGAIVARTLLDAAARSAAAERALAEAQTRVQADAVREVERSRQYRILHDTVLSTLSALSRGSLDAGDPQVRQRLAADADYLRGLIATTASTAGMRLVGALAAIGREPATSRLRVHTHIADVPDDLPPTVTDAAAEAVREALNNVAKHSGTQSARVTITGPSPVAVAGEPPARLQVTVADRGTGFDVAAVRRGIGLRESITARITESGGAVLIDSEPGQGTTVEMRWPA
ncbi:ATP-binding protein [Micromonospora polyrhachis]|uniref:Signal transduction histidine kinase n=1 Tax=Micromonospora polyrhachis TaxID=1282883 RepID=A0A7W7WMS2_9ACTN|nr:ATP-binding protein [Micromonospora polyrhachis]MBB4956897.1 signal transduction histidine kinase [Micromonospora polyrhachis]